MITEQADEEVPSFSTAIWKEEEKSQVEESYISSKYPYNNKARHESVIVKHSP